MPLDIIEANYFPSIGHPGGDFKDGVFVGFVSLFVKVVTTVLSQVPPVPVSDPFMNPNPNDVHVHPSHGDHAHA